MVEPITPEVISKETESAGVKTKEGKKRLGRNQWLVLGGVALLLVIIVIAVLVFLPNQYRFSFTINALPYYSNEYTPSEFFNLAKNSDSVIVSVDLVDGNADPWTVNALNLWLIAFNADRKDVTSLVKTVDSSGNLKSCITNDGNILQSRDLNIQECLVFVNDVNSLKINLHKSNQNKVILSSNTADIYYQKGEASAIVSYSFIKNIYPNFDTTLAIINEKINGMN